VFLDPVASVSQSSDSNARKNWDTIDKRPSFVENPVDHISRWQLPKNTPGSAEAKHMKEFGASLI
jgi:hypothetical protein